MTPGPKDASSPCPSPGPEWPGRLLLEVYEHVLQVHLKHGTLLGFKTTAKLQPWRPGGPGMTDGRTDRPTNHGTGQRAQKQTHIDSPLFPTTGHPRREARSWTPTSDHIKVNLSKSWNYKVLRTQEKPVSLGQAPIS